MLLLTIFLYLSTVNLPEAKRIHKANVGADTEAYADVVPKIGPDTKYGDILSILHNNKSNKIVLANIDNNLPPIEIQTTDDSNNTWQIKINQQKQNDVNYLKRSTKQLNHKIKPYKELNRIKRSNKEDKLIDELTEDPNGLKLIIETDDPRRFIKATEGHFKSNVTGTRIDEITRSKRNSAMYLLKSMFHPNYGPSYDENKTLSHIDMKKKVKESFILTDAIVNLTKAIEKLNYNLFTLNVSSNGIFKTDSLNVDADKSRMKRDLDDVNTKEDKDTSNAHVEENDSVNDTRVIKEINDLSNETYKSDDIVTEMVDATIENVTIDPVTSTEIATDKATEDVNDDTTNKAEPNKKRKKLSKESNKNKEPRHVTQTTEIDSSTIQNEEVLESDKTKPYPKLKSQRRFLDSGNDTDDLLINIDEIMREIQKKINPIKEISYDWSNNTYFKIGYVMSTVEMTEASINNLKKKISLHKDDWDVKKLEQVLKKLSSTNDILNNIFKFIESVSDN